MAKILLLDIQLILSDFHYNDKIALNKYGSFFDTKDYFHCALPNELALDAGRCLQIMKLQLINGTEQFHFIYTRLGLDPFYL